MIIHLRIEGIVQGVFYRQTIIKKAQQIGGISGWVRNRTDGSVELLAQGDENNLLALKNQCKIGSSSSVVTAVEELSVDDTTALPPVIDGVFRKESDL